MPIDSWQFNWTKEESWGFAIVIAQNLVGVRFYLWGFAFSRGHL